MSDQARDLPLAEFVTKVVGGGTPARSVPSNWSGPIPWASVKDIGQNDLVLKETQEQISTRALKESASNLIPAGTPVVCTRMAVGRVAMPAIDVAINQDLKALFPAHDVDSCYLLHGIQFLQSKLEAVATGSTVRGLRVRDLLDFRLHKPSIAEQRRVSSVLNVLDAQISVLQRIINKSSAVRLGLLADLMTRGVDVSGRLRPSAKQDATLYIDDTFGLRPKAWRVGLLDRFAKRGSGHTPSKNAPSYWNGGIRWVSLADSSKLDQFYIEDTDKQISQAGLANSSAVLHPAGTVILSRDAGVGKSAILARSMAVSQHFMTWQVGRELSNVYLYYWLQFMKRSFEGIALGSTIQTIGLSYFRKLCVTVPPLAEQEAIARRLRLVDVEIDRTRDELAALKLLKQGVASDLLSGRIRYKMGAAHDPGF